MSQGEDHVSWVLDDDDVALRGAVDDVSTVRSHDQDGLCTVA